MSDLPTISELRKAASPTENPFAEGNTVKVKTKLVKTNARVNRLVDSETGVPVAETFIHTIEERDDEHFVKVFADGVKAAYELKQTGFRVFQILLDEYQKSSMTGGFSECVRLYWFNDGLDGRDIGMSKKTFDRGIAELSHKGFIWPRSVELYWVNPALFFKGDRVAFVREIRRRNNGQSRLSKGAPDIE